MSRGALLHGAWGVIVITSFFLGSQVFPGGRGAIDAQAGEWNNLGDGTRAGRVPGNAATAGGRESNRDEAGRAEGGTGIRGSSQGPVTLTAEDITRLGDQFRTAASPIDRRLAFSRLLEGLTVGNAQLIREQIAHLPHQAAEFREFHYAWGALAGEDAVWNGIDTPKPDMSSTLAGWASADPAAARAFFEALPDSEKYDRNGLKHGALYGLTAADPELARQFVYDLTANGDREGERMIHIVTRGFLRTSDPHEAAQWVDGMPRNDLQIFARDRVAHDFVARDPGAAAEWAGQFNNAPEGSRLINTVSREWAHRDPEAAVEWLESLDSSDGKSEGLGSAFAAWAGRNPEAAGAYLHTMPRSPERDSALSGFANRIVHDDPPTAIGWANSIADPGVRERTLVETGRNYFRRDPEGAQEWLATSGLSPEAQQRVMKPKQR